MNISIQNNAGTPPASIALLTLVGSDGSTPTDIELPAAFTDVQNSPPQSGDNWTTPNFAMTGSVAPSYAFTFQGTYSGGLLGPIESGTVFNPTGASGMYINQAQLELYLGTAFTAYESDPDSTGNLDIASVQQAINSAEGECNAILSAFPSNVAVPLVFAGGVVDGSLVTHLCAMAGQVLIEKRVVEAKTAGAKFLLDERDRAIAWLESVRSGSRVLAGAQLATFAGTVRHQHYRYGFDRFWTFPGLLSFGWGLAWGGW